MKKNYLFPLTLILLVMLSLQFSAQMNPVANFAASPTLICVGETVQFTDQSTGSATSWSWSFPGGSPSTSTLQNPVVTYTAAQKYNAVLQVQNENGSNSKGMLNMVTVDICSSVKELSGQFNVSVFPNPTRSTINIQSQKDAQYLLFNATGQLLMQGNLKKDEATNLQLRDFSSGIYLLSIIGVLGTQTMKVIKE